MSSITTCQILNYNDWETVNKLVEYIHSFTSIDYIVITDNASTDISFDKLKEIYADDNKVKVISSGKNGGYGYGNNYGIKYAKEKLNSDFVIVTNPDCFFSDELIIQLKDIMKKKNAAIVSGIQKVNNKAISEIAWKVPNVLECTFAGTRLEKIFNYFYRSNYFDNAVVQVDCVPGAMFLVDPNKFLATGGYDEDMFLYCEETTLGFKLKKAGYKTFLLTKNGYDHQHSVSINKSIPSIYRQQQYIYTNRLLFLKRYLKEPKFMYFFSKKIFEIKLKKIKNKYEKSN